MQQSTTPAAGRRKQVVRGLIVLLLAGALLVVYLLYSTREKTPPTPPALLSPAALTVVPGIHLLGGLEPAAAYAVETTEGLVLIDSGLEPDARLLKQQLADLGLDWRRLRVILLTHVHGDHCGGAGHLQAATGAKIYAGREDASILKAGGPREAFFGTFTVALPTPQPLVVDVELQGGEEIEVGDAHFRALAAPGHTPGSTCYLMERQGQRVLFAGDVIMALAGDEKAPLRFARALGTYPAYMSPRYRGDAKSFLATLQTLRNLPAPDLVLPGHPRNDPTPQSPAMSQARWQSRLDQGIREMQGLLARYERDGELFLDGTPRRLLPDVYYLGDFEGSAVYGFFAASKFFLVDAPGGPGLLDFCHARLRKLGVEPVMPVACLLTSCGPEATAGLRELVAKSSAQVVASAAGVSIVKDLCPPVTGVLAAADLPAKGWFKVEALPLRGRGQAPIAYRLSWGKKTVLFSGRIPIYPEQAARKSLFDDVAAGRADKLGYEASLGRLRKLKPDLWLPAIPAGQNANLYDHDWPEILATNVQMIQRAGGGR